MAVRELGISSHWRVLRESHSQKNLALSSAALDPGGVEDRVFADATLLFAPGFNWTSLYTHSPDAPRCPSLYSAGSLTRSEERTRRHSTIPSNEHGHPSLPQGYENVKLVGKGGVGSFTDLDTRMRRGIAFVVLRTEEGYIVN